MVSAVVLDVELLVVAPLSLSDSDPAVPAVAPVVSSVVASAPVDELLELSSGSLVAESTVVSSGPCGQPSMHTMATSATALCA